MEKRKNSDTQRMVVFGGIVVVAVIALAAAIFLSSSTPTVSGDYSDIPMSRTDDGGFVLGNPDAAITVVAFEDFLCPHCQSYQTTVHQFIDEHVKTGDAKFEFRMLQTNQNSALLFSLAQCSEIVEPGSFWQAHDTLFQMASTAFFDERSARTFAEEMDIPYSEVLDCVSELEEPQYVADAVLVQQNPSQITGTPAVAWRLNDGPLRFDIIPRQPTAEQLSALVQAFGN